MTAGETMLGIHDLWLFIGAGFLLNITPEPDTAYIIGRSVQMGWRGGAAAALGIGAGCLVHVFGATVGLSALLAASSTAFTVVKLAGAAYLLVMNGTLWCLGIAALAVRASRQVRGSGRALQWINRVLGGVFVYLGVRVTLLDQN